jgi:hypothetical protein
MIALAGANVSIAAFPIRSAARPRTRPLDESSASAAPVYGGGKKGAKA